MKAFRKVWEILKGPVQLPLGVVFAAILFGAGGTAGIFAGYGWGGWMTALVGLAVPIVWPAIRDLLGPGS